MRKMVSLLCVSAMILTFTACGGSKDTSSSSETGSTPESSASEQSESSAEAESETEAQPATKPEVTKEGTLIRKATYVCEDDALYEEELYNDDGKLIKKSDMENLSVKEYEYDSNGNLIKETYDNNALITIKEYDEKGLLIHMQQKKKDQSEFDVDVTYTYEFDESGNRATSIPYQFEVEFSDGKKIKETEYSGEKVYKIHEYDSNGNETYYYVDYHECDGIADEEYKTEYDSEGRMIKVTSKEIDGTEIVLTYEYDAEGNNTIIKRKFGEYDDIDRNDSYEYEYDEYGNKIKGTRIQYGTVRLSYTVYEYKYD